MMSKLKAILTIGASASGKTTWSREFVKASEDKWTIIERDEIRFKLFAHQNGDRDWRAYKFTKAREKTVQEEEIKLIEAASNLGENIILSETHLNAKTRSANKVLLESYGYEVSFKEFDVPLDELWARDAQRYGGVGHTVIWKQWLQWLEYKGSWKYVPDESLPKAVALDVDGSLASMAGKRGPFEWHNVGGDEPITVNIDFAKGMACLGYELIIFSGRDGCCQELTEDWLIIEGIDYSDIYMRKAGDMRKDFIVKEEILKEASEKYNVVGVLDDRAQVTRMWNQIGLHCWNVGDPHNDF